jgi:hypothetical protein
VSDAWRGERGREDEKKGAADGREAKTRLCRRRAWKKTKNVFHGTQNERKTTVEALHDFAGRFIHSAAAKSAPATARAMEALGV